jgi:integrase
VTLTLLKESIMVRQAILASVTGIVRGAKYRDIWDLRVVLEYIKKGPPSEELPRKELMGRTAFLMIVLLPCRPVGMWRMEVAEEKWSEDGNSVEVPTKEKTNHGKGRTVLVIRRCSVANWCPLTCYLLLREQARIRGVCNSLWCKEQGKLYAQPSVILWEAKAVVVKAGIDRRFPAYSARHALITFLLRPGFSEVEVNAYTGHSNNSHTALSHSFHLDGNRAGRRIV